MNCRRIVIAGTRSGAGKTSIATGLMAALAARGFKVQGFKVGSDYIDPGYHTLAAGRPSRNLDTCLMTPDNVLEVFNRAAAGADIAIIEGVMGLYDGHRDDGSGSTAAIARLLAAPVLLVVDAASLGQSVAAEVLGYRELDPGLHLAGVILNRVSGENHLQLLRQAVASYTGIPVVGWLRKGALPAFPSRHLGLVPVGEQQGLQPVFQELAAAVAGGINLEAVITLAGGSNSLPPGGSQEFAAAARQAGPRVPLAIARDAAFSFYYQDALDYLEALGAELIYFSPLRDAAIPAAAAGLIIGGGFPEIYLQALAANRPLLADLRRRAAAGMPVYAECGGLMYLTREVTDLEDRTWELAGIVPAVCHMHKRLAGLGYRQAALFSDNLLGRRGDVVRGHEFHYSMLTGMVPGSTPAYTWVAGENEHHDGYATPALLASYLHLHFLGNRRAAAGLLAACRRYARLPCNRGGM